MRLPQILPVLLVLAGCGEREETFAKLAANRWAYAQQECGTRFVTFDGGTVKQHFADGTLVFGRIAKVGDLPPSGTMLTVEPSEAIRSAATRRKPAVPLPDAVTMGFELKGDQLSLVAMLGGDHGQIGGTVTPESVEFRLFKLTRCRA